MVNYETPWNHHFSGSEPSESRGWFAAKFIQIGKIPGILRVLIPGKPRVYLENTGYFADVSNDFCQILPQKSW